MAQVQATTTVTIDEVSYEVAALSAETQQMIALMDEWRQTESDSVNDLLMVRAAIRDVQNTLLVKIKEEVAAPAAPADQAPVVA